MDKILLANSQTDLAKVIYFFGEVSLAGIHALGFPVGSKASEYEQYKPFFIKLYE